MTPAGTLELPLLAIQLFGAIAGAFAGMRVVDDIRCVKEWSARRKTG